MILPNIKVYLEYCDVNNNDFIITKERFYSYYNNFINIFEEIKTNHNGFKDCIEKYSSEEKLIFEKIKRHFSPDIITSKIKFNVSFKNLMKNSPFLIISTLLFYRFFLLNLFGFNLFYKSIKNHKVEYRKGYYSVVEYFIAIYLISIREFIIMFICDIATFIYFSTNWKFLFVFIIFYLLTFNFIYLICLILSLSFNEFIYYLLSGAIKYVLSDIFIYHEGASMYIFEGGLDLITFGYFNISTIKKLRKFISPFNLLSDYSFSMETFLCCLLTLIILNFFIITLTLYKLKTVLKGSYGKFNLLKV
ncbi:hypothetical protein HERIO_1947 [Hepatospora eriocheir]|uniref:Uncharacterized protein n=1 Tax=Hepatospora eriocheir TaxID=1081669 RepID=A0A1X0Q8K7_9MICR|nr:hypothetical protein HERIO_1947 [Hepatospora eriocheir]